ncbi:MAG: PIN domain-containing protein [Thermoleophilia bacterium]
MKNIFKGYYSPTTEEFEYLWKNCWFLVDANILLNLYRYSPKAKETLIDILSKIKERLWLPHQAALEYQRNRLEEISKHNLAYDEVSKYLDKTHDKIKGNLLSNYGRHPFIKVENSLGKIENLFTEIQTELGEQKAQHPKLLDDDVIRTTITELFDGKVGLAYSDDELEKIYTQGQKRYKNEKPPGFADQLTKKGNKKYGDLVLWLQIIAKAKELQKPIIFITDDRKEDWWYKFKGRSIGPRPELIEEIISESGITMFYMYQADQFMKYARQYLKQEVGEDAIQEVRAVREYNENVTFFELMQLIGNRVHEYSEAIISSPAMQSLQKTIQSNAFQEALLNSAPAIQSAQEIFASKDFMDGIFKSSENMKNFQETMTSGAFVDCMEGMRVFRQTPAFENFLEGLSEMKESASCNLEAKATGSQPEELEEDNEFDTDE